jgi:hypothetical protein
VPPPVGQTMCRAETQSSLCPHFERATGVET